MILRVDYHCIKMAAMVGEIEDGSTIMKGTEADKAAGIVLLFTSLQIRLPLIRYAFRFCKLFLLIWLFVPPKANAHGSQSHESLP